MTDQVKKEYIGVDDFDSLNDIAFDDVYIPEWKKWIRLGSLTADDLLDWVEANEGAPKKLQGLRLLVKSIVDQNGNRIGTEELVEKLRKRHAGAVRRLMERATKLNGLEDKEDEKIKNVSSEAPSDASLIA